MSAREHHYRAVVTWTGSTAEGYRSYPREHTGELPPAYGAMRLSADPAFRGDPDLPNPEQLVVLAASSCQLLSFLAVAARAGVDVLDYADDATAVMPQDVQPVRITRITLRPKVTVAAGTDPDAVRRLVEQAHHECYIASSLRTQVDVVPEVAVAPSGSTTVDSIPTSSPGGRGRE